MLSELRKPRINPRVAAFIAETPLDELNISVVTLAEIRFGVESAPSVDLRSQLELWLDGTVRRMFGGRVLPLSEDVLLRWRSLAVEGQKAGRIYSQSDLLIAATALEYRLTLVTRNIKDFAGLPTPVFNPWE